MSRFPLRSDTSALVQQAGRLRQAGNYPQAIAAYTQALALEPDCTVILFNRGQALQMAGRWDEAYADYDRAIAIDPTYGLGYYGRGWVSHWRGDYQGELQDAMTGMRLDPQNVGMYLRRIGAALTSLGQFEKALQAYSDAIQLNPDDEGTIYNRGLTYLYMENFHSAIQDFDRALQLDPDWTWAFFHRGIAYEKLGDLEQALQDMDAALKYTPNYQPAVEARQRITAGRKTQKKPGFLKKLFG